MAASFAQIPTSDRSGNRQDLIHFSFGTAGAQNGAVEFVRGLPYSDVGGDGASGNGWELESVILGALVNGTWTDASLTATVEKTDGGTNMLATAPIITDDAGTGARNTAASGTGITQAVVHATEANRRLADGAGFIVTVTETGSAGGGADPEDVYVTLTFSRLQDFDPAA